MPSVKHRQSSIRLAVLPISIFFLMLLCLTTGCQCARRSVTGSAERRIGTVVVLHTNDLHANMLPDDQGSGGMANIAAYIKSVKASRPDVLAVDAGDMSAGKRNKPVPLPFYGRAMFEVMNRCGYDAATLGNHEFDKGPNEVYEFRRAVDFPLISSNLVYQSTLIADAPTALIDVNGLTIGLIGITTEDYFRSGLVNSLPIPETVQKCIDELEPKAHLIIGLSHLGCDKDCELACAVSGLDVIVGGHTHTLLCDAVDISDTIIVQAGEFGEHVGRLELSIDLDTEEILEATSSLAGIPVSGLVPDPETQAVVEAWERKAAETHDGIIGKNSQPMTISEVTAVMEQIWKETLQTDFAYQNPDGTQAPLPPGDISAADVLACMPFENTLVVLTLTRQQVLDVLPHALFSTNKPLYTLVTNSYAAQRIIDQYAITGDYVQWTAINWRDPVIDSIKAHGSLDGERDAHPIQP